MSSVQVGMLLIEGCVMYRLVCCLSLAVSARPMQQQQALWLSLLWDVLVACPAHAANAALALPLTVVPAGKQHGADGGFAAAQDYLLQVWKAVGVWTASEGVSGEIAILFGFPVTCCIQRMLLQINMAGLSIQARKAVLCSK